MLAIGQLLRERYRVDGLPEQGAGAPTVYRGYDRVEGRPCAIREIEGDDIALLEREAEALASHRHPNLPLLYDTFTADSRLYAVFEWPEGESLQARLKREGRIAETDATRWMGQILAALDYIHALNLPIGRGGFSPAHIWIAPDGQAKLYGGGLTELFAPPQDGDRSPYLAPEGGTNQRSDVYSAGATLYALLTAHHPEHTSPRKLNPSITLPTAQVIQRALEARPEARYANIREMRKALGRAKPRAREAKLGITLRTAPRPFPVWPALGAVGVVLVLASGVIAWRRLAGAPAGGQATRAQAPTAVSSPLPPPTVAPAATSAATLPPPTATARPSPTAPPSPTADLTPQGGSTAVAPPDQMVLVFVPRGEFLMGSADSDVQAFGNEKPQHTVFVPDFWIDRTEVTNGQYRRCVEAGACIPPAEVDSVTRPGYYDDPSYAGYPVIWVNWRQASAYCQWAGRRLPTEAEWEKAARGTQGRLYPWGDQPPDNTLLNYNLAAGDTTRAGSFPNGASPYGALDMAGNVVEWVADFYYDSYFVAVVNTVTPTPSFRGGVRALRSSSWNDLIENIRAASRLYSVSETSSYNSVGFRCASSDRP